MNFRDYSVGGSCKFNPQTNLPNENCVFVPSGDNSKIRSSYMSLPFLQNVSKICFLKTRPVSNRINLSKGKSLILRVYLDTLHNLPKKFG